MSKITVYNQQGEKKEEMEIPAHIFDAEVDTRLLQAAVRTHLAKSRATIASTKDRSEVRGGGRKPWRQKGTGRARHGSIRSPLWTGGGVTFGPNSLRNWSLRMNKRAKAKALSMALSSKVQEKDLFVIDKLELSEPKTKEFNIVISDFTKKLKMNNRGLLLIIPEKLENLERAAKNVADVKIIRADSLNTYDILKAHKVIFLKDSIEKVKNVYFSKFEKVKA